MPNRILLIFFVVMVGSGLCGCERKVRNQTHLPNQTEFSGVDISAEGRKLQDFYLEDIRDGKEVSRGMFVDRVLLVAFVASWCPLCREEMLDLQELRKFLPENDFSALGVASTEEDLDEIKVIVKQLNLSYPMVVNDPELEKSFGSVSTVPVAFLVDRQGLIRKKYLSHLDISVVKADIESLLNRGNKS